MAKSGTIIVDARTPAMVCNIIDISAGGACLDMELKAATSMPKRFELLYGGNRKKCRVVWAAGRRLGVCF